MPTLAATPRTAGAEHTATATDTVAAARALQPMLRERADEIERARRLPADIAATFASAGLFRTAVPASLGGLELPPARIMATIEAVGQADASAGWAVMIGATSGMSAAYLEPEVARTIYGDPLAITGGSNTPTGRARAEGGGYRLSGRWPWVSGGANCQWLKGISVVLEDGKPRLLANGAPDARMMVFPAEQATLIDTWQVAGLEGTGSGDMEVTDIHVPAAFSYSLVTDAPRESGALYRFPPFGLLAMGIASVALGNARAAIDDLVELAGAKKPQGSRRTLAERGGAQAELARAEAMLRSARAFFFEAIHEAWERAESTRFADEGPRPGCVHGDLHPGNAIFADGTVRAVIDFDSVRIDHRACELSAALLHFANHPMPGEDPVAWREDLDLVRLHAFAESCMAALGAPLSAAELAAIPWLMIEACALETLVPVARTGRFAQVRADRAIPFLVRKCEWIARHVPQALSSRS